MGGSRKTWGMVRRIYFGVGLFALFFAIAIFFVPGAENPLLYFAVPVLVIGAAVFAGDDLFNRIHRIFGRREWPK